MLFFITFLSAVICHYSRKSPNISCSDNTAKTRKNKTPFAWEHSRFLEKHWRIKVSSWSFLSSLDMPDIFSMQCMASNKRPKRSQNVQSFIIYLTLGILPFWIWGITQERSMLFGGHGRLCFVLRDSLRGRVQSRAPTNSAPCRNFHIMQYHAYGVCWLFLQGNISRLEPRWRRGFHIGGYKKSFQTLLAHLRWDVRIICAPKMRLPGSRQMPVASFVSFIQRRRLPKHWMNQTSACGYLVRNTR